MSATADRFAEFYTAVYGREPFPWQVRLAERVCRGEGWPRAVALPTAAGKTCCIDIALFALACGAPGAARRIFFVVDRRVVVDQARDHAKKLADILHAATSGVVRDVAQALRAVGGGCERPLDVYALRGGMYRETAWARSPLQPTVLASTVDQVGSRLLFRGYGVSRGMLPVHAGLVGNDALVLLDEAHCAKPFEQTMARVERYRRAFKTEGDPTPFAFAALTATPTGGVTEDQTFRLDETVPGPDLDPNEPKKTPKRDLHDRVSASKPARLVVSGEVAASPAKPGTADDKRRRKQLVATLAEQARGLLQGGRRAVGVIVNRVATARELAALLATPERDTDPVDVILLTGRMRPVDRDAIMTRLAPLMSGSTLPLERPTVVVATQCLEVGADLDFHALVTECASLDALRQRFGRLNRVAARENAPAAVVVRGDQTVDTAADPVYGAGLARTWAWLNANAAEGVFDFAVLAVNKLVAALPAGDLAALCAPSDDAAVLLPAHLDGWVQTSPPPTPDRDIAPYLHGPKRGVPDVSVVFRGDLGGYPPDRWAAVVELCPPSSAEALPVRIDLFGKWLEGTLGDDLTGDADEAAPEEPDRRAEPEPTGRVALRWRGPEDSEPVRDRQGLRPGDVFVLPCDAPDAHRLGDFPTLPPADCGDAAFLVARDKAVMRLPDLVLSQDDEEFAEKLTAAVEGNWPADLPVDVAGREKRHLTHRTLRVAQPYPGGMTGWAVAGRRRLGKYEPEFLDDDASSASPARRQVTLADHSAGVADHAARFAAGCGLDESLYRQAGLFHDTGKLDPRFQGWLLGGRRRAFGAPLAKSGAAGGTRADRNAARERSGYPRGGRHEALSAALLAGRTGDDLLLHLVATHHGSARPFVEPPEGEAPEAVPLPACPLFGVAFAAADCGQRPAAWNPALAERFWRVVRRYGWWGSAYREAVFRLADQAQSAAEQREDWSASPAPPPAGPLPPPAGPPELTPIALPGLDGANPLAYLAALGALRLADRAFGGRAKLSWDRAGRWTPTLHVPAGVTPEELAEELLKAAPAGRRVLTFADDIKLPWNDYRGFQREAAEAADPTDREFGDFLAAFADERVVIESGPNAGRTKPTAFYMVAGQQTLIGVAKQVAAAATPAHLTRCLTGTWRYDDPLEKLSARWDPLDDVRYALRFVNPSGDPIRKRRGSVVGANRLAFEALPFFACIPRRDRLQTTGFGTHAWRTHWTWPLWTEPLPADAVRSFVALAGLSAESVARSVLAGYGVQEIYRAERVANGDYSNFAPATVG